MGINAVDSWIPACAGMTAWWEGRNIVMICKDAPGFGP